MHEKTWAGLWAWTAFEFCGITTLLAAVWLLLRFADKRRFSSIGFGPRGMVKDLGLGTLLGFGLIALTALVLLISGNARAEIVGSVHGPVLWVSAVATLLNAATQEVLVRGYILQTIRLRFGEALAVFVSSLIFAAMHPLAFSGETPLPALNIFIIGVLFGIAYARTGSLWLPIAAHFGWNYMLGPVLGLIVSGRDITGGWQLMKLSGSAGMAGGNFGLEGSIITTVVCLLAIPAIIAMTRNRNRHLNFVDPFSPSNQSSGGGA